MDSDSWQGADRGNSPCYGEDLQRRHGPEDALCGAEICEAGHQVPGVPDARADPLRRAAERECRQVHP